MMFEHECVVACAPAKNRKAGRVVGRCAVTWRGLGPACQRDYSAACPTGCLKRGAAAKCKIQFPSCAGGGKLCAKGVLSVRWCACCETIYFAVVYGSTGWAPPGYTLCHHRQDLASLSPREKKQFEDNCGVRFPCSQPNGLEPDCERAYETPCPRGWYALDGAWLLDLFLVSSARAAFVRRPDLCGASNVCWKMQRTSRWRSCA